jgi:energy-coupling factor transporter ATP-binding protein EcfA2
VGEADTENRKPVTIFISSPGDVIPERRRLKQVVKLLQVEFGAHLELRTVTWETQAQSAVEHFQSQIPRPSSADIVVVILWWRLGTVLQNPRGRPHEWDGPLSRGEVTGTEWEFEEARHGAQQHDGKPTVLVYRKTHFPPYFESDEQIASYSSEKGRVEAFFARWFRDPETGSYTNAFRQFSDEAEFEELVDEHLRDLLRKQITSDRAGGEVRWAGSPFRGLTAYGVADGPIFFGRIRAVQRLRELAQRRADAKSPWVLVTGASGSGKSSLVMAGLLTDVRTPGVVAGVGETRYVVVRPSDAEGHPLDALVDGLLGELGLPELGSAPLVYNTERLRGLLAAGGDEASHAIRQGRTAAGSHLTKPDRALLVVVVDQLEELFRLPERERRNELVQALTGLSKVDGVWIVATIRSDFLQQLDGHPLSERFDSDGRYLLGSPTPRELGQIITRPAALAGLSWQTGEDGRPLDEVLQEDAKSDPAALPLLGYVLEQLWHRRDTDLRNGRWSMRCSPQTHASWLRVRARSASRTRRCSRTGSRQKNNWIRTGTNSSSSPAFGNMLSAGATSPTNGNVPACCSRPGCRSPRPRTCWTIGVMNSPTMSSR